MTGCEKTAKTVILRSHKRRRISAFVWFYKCRDSALDAEEYYRAVEQASAHGVMGSTINDALVASCALKVKADTLYTWNVKHFQQFSGEMIKRIKTP